MKIATADEFFELGADTSNKYVTSSGVGDQMLRMSLEIMDDFSAVEGKKGPKHQSL